ncbi:MAG: DUF2752 domain-containing protein [Sphingobacteriaceae bacterium]|nr:DUF2752 domain-containing protein [Sphingobacteriaceae bacterium]
MLPCFFKHLTGFDCPGCGFQRSVLALFNGDFKMSITLYPAAVFILIFTFISLVNAFYPRKTFKTAETISLYLSVIIGAVSYLIKIINYTSEFTAA